MVRSSKCPQVTGFGDVQVFDAEPGEIRHGNARGSECHGRIAVLADLHRADRLIRRVLQFTQLLTLTARIDQQERSAAQDIRVQFLLARGVRAHISAVGADSPGKQELDPDILRRASLLLVDSRRQCEKLGELQHAPDQSNRALEIGEYCEAPVAIDPEGITVADFTGLGVEDLYIAESCYLGAL